jgi:hypothetical protein
MFAGGTAAVTLAKGSGKSEPPKKCENEIDGELCLSKKPRGETLRERFPNGQGENIPADGTVKPLIFATDTTLGLKVAWSGTTAQFPDSFKFGFNRKEFAFAPILGRELKDSFRVRMPSFLAGVDQSVTWQWFWALSTDKGDKANYVNPAQFFATGQAAEELAKDAEIQKRKKAILKSQDNTTP